MCRRGVCRAASRALVGTLVAAMLTSLAVAAPAASAVASPSPAPAPTRPFGSHRQAYARGTIRPTGPPAHLDAQVVAYYRAWKTAFVHRSCGNGWYEIFSPDADHPYVGEGQGFGLVIMAMMAGADPEAKTIFDGILEYVLDHPSTIDHDLLGAEQNAQCQSVNGGDSATDGDLDVAYGLLLAARQWGSAGTYDYRALAVRRINAIAASEVSATTHLTLLGDWASFGKFRWGSRSSDWMLDHFRAFAAVVSSGGWGTILAAQQYRIAVLQAFFAPVTGLLPDFVQSANVGARPAKGKFLESKHDGAYSWNACRDPWRIGTDAVISGDAYSTGAARKINAWARHVTGGDPGAFGSGYQLDGTRFNAGNEPAFFAPLAVAAMTDPASQVWLDALWQHMLATPVDPQFYFGATIQLQVMILASGNYLVP